MTLIKSRIALVLAAGVVAGCATTDFKLPTLPGFGPQNLVVGKQGSADRVISVTPPANTCNTPAYLNGYKLSYVRSWNEQVQAKQIEALVQSQQHPKDKALQTKHQRLSESELVPAEAAATPLPANLQAASCESSARLAGENDGILQGRGDANTFLATVQ